MVALTLRSTKGSPLTNNEVDANFTNLNAAVQPVGGTAGQILSKIDDTNFNSQWIDNYATQLKMTVKNDQGATITKGQVVYVSGANGANVLVKLAQANAEITSSTTIGFLEQDLAVNGIGLVVLSGSLAGINTSTAAAGDPIWLSSTTAGGVVYGAANKPVAPAHMVYLGVVTRVHAINGEIDVKVANGYELSELHDVLTTSPTDMQPLVYEASTGLWKNKTLGVLGGGTGVTTLTGLAYGNGTSAFTAASAAEVVAVIGSTPVANATNATTATTADSCSGNAATATVLQTARNINGVSFNGSADITVTANTTNTLTRGTYLTGSNFNGSAATTWAVDAATANTANKVVARDGSGNFSAGTITATLNGNATTATTAGNVSGTVAIANGGTGATTAGDARTNLGATTVGSNFFTLANPSAITFPRINADNTVDALSEATFRSAIGAGTGNGTVTSVSGTGSASGLSLSGTVTTSGSISLSGSVTSVDTASNLQMNSLGVGVAGSGTAGEIRATNNVTAYYSSDRSLKENIQDVQNPLNIAVAIGSKTFDWTDAYIKEHGGEDGYFVRKSDFGVIAQDVQQVFPQAVRTRPDGTLAVDYEKLGTLAFGAIAQLLKRIEALEAR